MVRAYNLLWGGHRVLRRGGETGYNCWNRGSAEACRAESRVWLLYAQTLRELRTFSQLVLGGYVKQGARVSGFDFVPLANWTIRG